ALRERVLADLARRRNAGKAQIEQLREGRDRLLGAYEVVQRTLDHAVEQLRLSAPDAHAVVAPAPAALPASTDAPADDAEEAEGIRVLTPPAPPEPTEPTAPVAVEGVAVEEVVVEEVVVDEVVVDEVVVEDVIAEEEILPADEVTEETPVVPADPTIDESVDELFARIRAARADEVAKAEDVLAADEAVPVAPDVDQGPDVFELRSGVLAPLEASLGRKLRRVLADDQNEVLDRLRQGSKLPALDALVGDAVEHAGRYASPARADIESAARSGAEIVAGTVPEGGLDLDDVVTDLGVAVSGPLRERLEACLADSGGDVDEATELVRAAYREWKTQRLDAAAADALLAGFNRGAFAGAPPGCLLRWVVAPDQAPCPDADDNALAGDIERGTAFPTGHLHAPAHPGCRCQVVIAPR
ncbi:MAG TPA: hypothetical protein VMK16_10540, partial [Acidimicrobiales bacterium]|nr:hypothetical protein [Acidimicrobiales bacterium]